MGTDLVRELTWCFAQPRPACKESRNKTLEEDNFDGGEISGHLWRREKDGNEFQEPEERRRLKMLV